MRRAKLRNSILAVSGTLASLAAILFFNLGCPGSGDLPTPPDPVVTVLVDPGSGTIVVGRTIQLSAVTYASGGLLVTGRTVTWSSADPTVASVSSAGLVTGVAAGGPIAITATSEGKSASAQITVTPVPVASITVTGPTSILRDATAQFTATPKDANGATLTGRAVTWSSGNSTIASVASDGTVTGVQEGGPVNIVAVSEGITGSAQVTVTPLPVARVTVGGLVSVQVGLTTQMEAFVYDTHDHVVLGRVVTWSSSLPAVASVSGTGVVTGVSVGGPVTITGTSEGKSGSTTITVTPPPTPAILSGRVIDYETQSGIAPASVDFIDVNSFRLIGSTTTAADGSFTSPGLTGITGPVVMDARATGYTDGRVLVASVPLGVTTFTEPIPLVLQTSTPGGISGTVRNARTGQGVPAAGVDLFNNISTVAISHTVADANGLFTFNGIAAGTYRLVGSATGYQPATRVGVAVGHNAVTSGQDLVLSPTGTNDIRIVLTWGSTPSDLDSHLTGPNADATRFHVYYSSRGSLTSAPFAFLDIDDVSSFGPETITITQFNSGNYRYSVHDYSNRSSSTSTALGHSSAKVEVYTSTGLVQTFFVPNEVGTLWTVFEMTGSIANPVITPRNQMSLENDPSTILSPPADGSTRATDGALIGRAVQQHPKVKPQ